MHTQTQTHTQILANSCRIGQYVLNAADFSSMLSLGNEYHQHGPKKRKLIILYYLRLVDY
jgi:hypothetical protein